VSNAKSQEIVEKTQRLQRMLESKGLGGVLIGGQPNFSWLSAGGSNGIDLSREPGAGFLLARSDGKKFVLANRIEMPRLLAEEMSEVDFEPVEFSWEEEKEDPEFLLKLARSLLTSAMPLGSDLQMSADCECIEGAIAECRYQLTDNELERYRLLGRDAGVAIANLAKSLEPGETELEIARRAADTLAACNARAVVNLVAADERLKKFRHPVPAGLAWEKTVMIVVCARRHGLTASLTRIVNAGPVSEELRERTRSVATVNANLMSSTRAGITGAEIYNTAARVYAETGFPGQEHIHHQGGACGYRTRDWVAHPTATQKVLDRQAFAWNPSITGTKAEETLIYMGDRIETITSSPGWPTLTVRVDGTDYDSPDVLSL
jgi:Xaa-Pro dipeptidase